MDLQTDATRARLALARVSVAAVAEAAAALSPHPEAEDLTAHLLALLASIVVARAGCRELSEPTQRKECAA